MSKSKKILIIIPSLIITIFNYNNPIILIIIILFLSFYLINSYVANLKQNHLDRVNEIYDFHEYLKSVILLSYSRPVNNAFSDIKMIDNKKLKKKIEKFLNDCKYDFSHKPYRKLALSINSQETGINYELNIMYLLFELQKKGLGSEFITDILIELDLLIENEIDSNVEKVREQAYIYTLCPTIINFFYLTIVLFKVIDIMILSVLQV